MKYHALEICCPEMIHSSLPFDQVDVTSKTEGKAFADATGVPLLVKYDTRIRDTVAKGVTKDVTDGIEVITQNRAHRT